MPETFVRKYKLVGTGYAEMPMDGRRYRFRVERYRADDGSEWGRIVEKQEIPNVGPYLWIPSYCHEAAEAQYLEEEAAYEKEHPHPDDVSWWGEHRAQASKTMDAYNEARDARAEWIRRNPVTAKGRR